MPERYEDLARAALLEITPPATVGAYAGSVEEAGAVSVLFDCAMPGYPGWKWTVSIAQVDDAEPTVLEAELMPAEGALLAPDWVPWSERLAEYKAAQEALEGASDDDPDDDEDVADDESDDEDDDLDDDEIDDEPDEDDVLGSDVLHGGDVDGVDIDDLDEESDDSDEDSDEDERSY